MKTTATGDDAEGHAPTFGSALAFRAKTILLQTGRAARNALDDEIIRRPRGVALSNATVIAESISRLRRDDDGSEAPLLAGKIHNLRLAVRRLDGAEVAAGGVFSFWAQVGRTSRRKGYVRGRELREGCLIPSTGGGICQLSNALYDAALRAGFEIVERHAHSRVVAGSLAEIGRDATVFWNHVDLRFKSPRAFRIEASMDSDCLTVRIRCAAESYSRRSVPLSPPAIQPAAPAPQSCFSCGVQDCFRHAGAGAPAVDAYRSAFLVDEYWPEFDRYLCGARREQDLLFVPLDGKRFGRPNYAWGVDAFRHVRQAWRVTLRRAFTSRNLSAQGAARQRALLAFNERLARGYAALLPYDVKHLIVAQNLLPYLWREGHLGGRTFDVLMTALPLSHLHERLNLAAALNPQSATLADFRADDDLVRAEGEALRQARKLITPHSGIAGLYGDKTVLLDWAVPERKASGEYPPARRGKIVFPTSTLGRKGAYELRSAIRGLDLQLRVVGAELEGQDFWQGIAVEYHDGGDTWLDGARAVVLPAYVEHKPRRLLEGVARGVPVIASSECGLRHVKGVVHVPAGDVEALRREIMSIVSADVTRADYALAKISPL
jgi:hypothetical protein